VLITNPIGMLVLSKKTHISERYIAYKLELNQVEKITLIENTEEHKFTLIWIINTV